MMYQIVILVIPLVIAPYLTRTLGDSSLGIYSYTYSIVTLFIFLARLGIDKHGQRLIAAVRDDEEKLRKSFWSLYFVHAIVSFFVLIVYYFFVLFVVDRYREIFIIQGISLFCILFDITWFFYGIENMKLVVIENLCVKVAELISIFVFVHSKDDLGVYTFIMSISLLVGYLIVLPYAFRLVKPIKFGWKDIKQHFKPLCVLFVAVFATILYQVIDKTLLGIFSTEANVAYYEYANKIICVPLNIIFVIGTVLMPRACACAARGDTDNQKKYMDYSMHFVAFLGFGSTFGIISVAPLFATIYYGRDFSFCGDVMMVLSPIIVLLGLENVVRTQYMIPNHMDKQFTTCLWIASILHLIISISLIPIFGVYGAVYGTIISEVICTLLQFVICRFFISIKKVLKIMVPYGVIGFVMSLLISYIKCFYNTSVFHLLLQIVVGIICYCFFSMVHLVFFSDIKTMVRQEIKKILARIKQ